MCGNSFAASDCPSNLWHFPYIFDGSDSVHVCKWLRRLLYAIALSGMLDLRRTGANPCYCAN